MTILKTYTFFILLWSGIDSYYYAYKNYHHHHIMKLYSSIDIDNDMEFFQNRVINEDSNRFWNNNANLAISNNNNNNHINAKYSNDSTKHDVLLKFQSFNTEVLSNTVTFNPSNAASIHKAAICLLIQSDVQNRDDNENSELTYFPESYIHAMYYIEDTIKLLQQNENPITSVVKIIYKKEGLNSFMKSSLLTPNGERITHVSQMMTTYEIVAIKRKVERCISLIMTLLLSQRSCRLNNLEDDLIYFSKVLMEKTPIHDRHLALLILCRGMLSPTFNRQELQETGDVQYVCRSPYPSMKQSFRTSMTKSGVKQPSAAARILFPFVSTALRCYAILSGNAQTEEYETFTNTDLQFGSFVKNCIENDKIEGKLNAFVDEEDELFSSMRRWLCDTIALHFIAEDARKEVIPEEIRRNTVAMEILSTDRVFSEGRKRDRVAYLSLMAEIGKYLDIMMNIADSDLVDSSSLFLNLKRFIATISSIRGLPLNHKLRKKFEFKLKINYLSPNAVQTKAGNVKTYLYQSTSQVSDDDFFAPKSRSYSVKSSIMHDSDENLFAPSQSKGFAKAALASSDISENEEFWATSGKKKPVRVIPEPLTKETLLIEIENTLLQVIADTLKIDDDIILNNESIKYEIADVFSSWRKPQLLLEYYRMHRSSQDLQNLFARFLKALFGITDETYDDIRYRDIGNRYHFDCLPSELGKQWVDGKTQNGKLLPGYNDAQTLFMLGEDSNTCMSIRSRQKGTNRGLLSFLLHGNVRVVGVKDQSGKLLARAVTRLLIDEETKRPVLYVETPYGGTDEDSYLDVYDQAAELGRLLKLPVIYASAPKPALYIMSPNESPAALSDSAIDDDYYSYHEGKSIIQTDLDHSDLNMIQIDNLMNVTDYTLVSPYIWIDGIKSPKIDKYVFGRTPTLIKRILDKEFVVLGARPAGYVESTDNFWGSFKAVNNTSPYLNKEETLFGISQAEDINDNFLFSVKKKLPKPNGIGIKKSIKKGINSVQSRLFLRQKTIIETKETAQIEKDKNKNKQQNNNLDNANDYNDDKTSNTIEDDDYFFSNN